MGMWEPIDTPRKANAPATQRKWEPSSTPAAGDRVILVSGDKHCGKTTLVERYIASLAGQGLRIGGILARGLWEDDLRAGFDLVTLADGKTTPLARRRRDPHPQHRMMFDFLDAGMRAGAQALDADACRHADLVVVDELGRLEARGEGWAPHVTALLALTRPRFLFVARLDCLQRIRDRFGIHHAPVIDVRDPHARDHLGAAVARVLASG